MSCIMSGKMWIFINHCHLDYAFQVFVSSSFFLTSMKMFLWLGITQLPTGSFLGEELIYYKFTTFQIHKHYIFFLMYSTIHYIQETMMHVFLILLLTFSLPLGCHARLMSSLAWTVNVAYVAFA